MSETLNEQDAVFGAITDGGKSDSTDWKQRYEQLEKDFASARVEQGRVKKLDEEKKALERELEELKAAKGREDILSSLSDDERESIAPEVLSATAKLLEQQRAEYDRKLREIESRNEQASERGILASKENFARRVDESFPGFFSSVCNGGPNAEAWRSYKRFNGASIDSAYANFDFEAVSHHIRRFYNETLGVDAPVGVSAGSSAPEPQSTSGGNGGFAPSTSAKTYTRDEILALYDRIEKCRVAEDFKEAARIESEIDRAIAEGRVR